MGKLRLEMPEPKVLENGVDPEKDADAGGLVSPESITAN